MSESPFDVANRDYSSLEAHSCGDDEQASMTGPGLASQQSPDTQGEIGADSPFFNPVATAVTWQLDLNERNLHSFKSTVQSGNVPLRTDFVDSRDYAAHTRAAAPHHSVAGQTEYSLCSQGMPTEHQANSNSFGPAALYEAKYDRFEKSHGSAPTLLSENEASLGNTNNPLNVTNLQHHVQILSSGKPVTLRPENICVSCEGKSPQPGMNYTNSLLVEPPSDSSLHEGSRGYFGYSTLFPETDQWSTQSVGEIGFSDFISESNLRSLSKENLLQLKRELESDSIPLRPELLAGLENAVKAITGPASDEPSLFVACSQNATQAEMTLDRDPDQDQDQDPVTEAKSDMAQNMETEAAGMSFHSMMVEPRTEFLGRADDHGSLRGSNSENNTMNPQDHNSEELLPEEDEAKTDSDDSRECYSSNLSDNEEGLDSEMKHRSTKRFTPSTRAGQLLTQDMLEANSRCVRAMQISTMKSIKKLCDRLESLESGIAKVMESQQAIHEVLLHSSAGASRAATGAVSVTITVNGVSYLFPFEVSTTVGECKRVAMDRLSRIGAVSSRVDPNSVVAFLSGAILFDEDKLGSLGISSGAIIDFC